MSNLWPSSPGDVVRRALKTMNNAVEYLLNHGCSVLFAWVLAEQAGIPIPSAPILLTAGALVGFGRMSCAAALGLPLAACLIGDCAWFSRGDSDAVMPSWDLLSHVSSRRVSALPT